MIDLTRTLLLDKLRVRLFSSVYYDILCLLNSNGRSYHEHAGSRQALQNGSDRKKPIDSVMYGIGFWSNFRLHSNNAASYQCCCHCMIFIFCLILFCLILCGSVV